MGWNAALEGLLEWGPYGKRSTVLHILKWHFSSPAWFQPFCLNWAVFVTTSTKSSQIHYRFSAHAIVLGQKISDLPCNISQLLVAITDSEAGGKNVTPTTLQKCI